MYIVDSWTKESFKPQITDVYYCMALGVVHTIIYSFLLKQFAKFKAVHYKLNWYNHNAKCLQDMQ